MDLTFRRWWRRRSSFQSVSDRFASKPWAAHARSVTCVIQKTPGRKEAPMRSLSKVFRLLMLFVLAGGLLAAVPPQAQASTAGLRGVNWADQRDNFVNGVLYVSGLTAADTYSSAAATADQVVG